MFISSFSATLIESIFSSSRLASVFSAHFAFSKSFKANWGFWFCLSLDLVKRTNKGIVLTNAYAFISDLSKIEFSLTLETDWRICMKRAWVDSLFLVSSAFTLLITLMHSSAIWIISVCNFSCSSIVKSWDFWSNSRWSSTRLNILCCNFFGIGLPRNVVISSVSFLTANEDSIYSLTLDSFRYSTSNCSRVF